MRAPMAEMKIGEYSPCTHEHRTPTGLATLVGYREKTHADRYRHSWSRFIETRVSTRGYD